MVPLTSLLVPVLLSAVLVFLASSVLHMMTRWHRNDVRKVGDEDGVVAALRPGSTYLEVFRFAGVTAFAGYSLALMQNSIWWGRNWGTTVRSMLDGLLYSMLTAGAFGWLWPQ